MIIHYHCTLKLNKNQFLGTDQDFVGIDVTDTVKPLRIQSNHVWKPGTTYYILGVENYYWNDWILQLVETLLWGTDPSLNPDTGTRAPTSISPTRPHSINGTKIGPRNNAFLTDLKSYIRKRSMFTCSYFIKRVIPEIRLVGSGDGNNYAPNIWQPLVGIIRNYIRVRQYMHVWFIIQKKRDEAGTNIKSLHNIHT